MQEWNQNDTYNLYLSDTRGIYFTLAMENLKTTRGIGGNQMLDLYEVGQRGERPPVGGEMGRRGKVFID